MPELEEIMNEIPAEILGADEDQPNAAAGGEGDGESEEDNELNQPAGTDSGASDDTADDDDTETETEKDTEEDESEEGAKGTEDDNEDYVTSLDEEDEPVKPADPPKPPETTDENSHILNGLNKIAVRIIVPGDKEGESVEKTVEVYGYGDLPRNYMGFASQYEAGVFNQAVIAQEGRAKELQAEYRQNQMQSDMADYTRKENSAIAEDLTELRRDGLFPKFKGNPGTKEFNDSDGAKEFDKVIAFMNERNRSYQRAAQNGRAYRHIGFREAYDMLNGPNPGAKDKAEQRGRRQAAQRLATSRGTKSSQRNVSNKPVQNITDLEAEFEQFAGQGAK